MRTRWIFACLIVGLGLSGQLPAQSESGLAVAVKQRDAAVLQIQAGALAQKSELFDKYAASLDTLYRQFTAKGDLDSLLIIKNEIESARLQRAVSKGKLEALESYRATLNKSLAAIDGATVKSQAQIDANYLRSLNQMKIDLTKAGRLEEAVAVDKEIKSVAAGSAPSAADTPPKPATPSTGPSQSKPLKTGTPLMGKVVIEVGTYREKEPLIVGTQGKNKGSYPPGMVYLQPGTEVEGMPIFVREGLLSADRTLFKDARIVTELSGTFEAKNCILRECTMGKGGPAFVNFFSSKWSFENCVITGTFFSGWKLTDYGVKAVRCTFHDVDFVAPIYKRDAGEEVMMEWQLITRCKFVGCAIPETLFLATKDCIFEDCRFPATKEKYPISTPIKVRAYVSAGTKVPPAPALCKYEILDTKLVGKDIGGDLKYEKTGKAVKFQ